MTRNRIVPVAAAAAALLLTGGIAYAVTTADSGSNLTSQPAITVTGSPAGASSEPSTGAPARLADDSASASPSAPDDSASVSPSPSPSPSSSPDDSATGAPAEETAISSDEAVRIALDHVGGGRVDELEWEREHGRLEWEVEIVWDGLEYEVRIDAATGEIIEVDIDDD